MEQSRSSLLTRLPYEIRMVIYEHAVGNQRVHLTPQGGRLACMPCVAPERSTFSTDEQTLHDECLLNKHQSQHCAIRTVQVTSPPFFSPQWIAVPDMGLGLPRTCRQMYVCTSSRENASNSESAMSDLIGLDTNADASYLEAAHLVYSRNLFLIHTLGALFRFVEMTPSCRLSLVKEIYVTHNVNGVDFVKATYSSQGMQKLPMEMAPLFMFDYFQQDRDRAEAISYSSSASNDREEGFETGIEVESSA